MLTEPKGIVNWRQGHGRMVVDTTEKMYERTNNINNRHIEFS